MSKCFLLRICNESLLKQQTIMLVIDNYVDDVYVFN